MLRFTADFASGNLAAAECVSDIDGTATYVVRARADPGAALARWFHFALENPSDQAVSVRLRIGDLDPALAQLFESAGSRAVMRLEVRDASGQAYLGGAGDEAGASPWEPLPVSVALVPAAAAGGAVSLTLTASFEVPRQLRCRLAAWQPYTCASLDRTLGALELDHEGSDEWLYLRRETLVHSRGARPLVLVTITAPPTIATRSSPRLPGLFPDTRPRPRAFEHRRVVLVVARARGAESAASFALDGALAFLVSRAPQAEFLRRRLVFLLVPMANPDAVDGGLALDVCGADAAATLAAAELADEPALAAVAAGSTLLDAALGALARCELDERTLSSVMRACPEAGALASLVRHYSDAGRLGAVLALGGAAPLHAASPVQTTDALVAACTAVAGAEPFVTLALPRSCGPLAGVVAAALAHETAALSGRTPDACAFACAHEAAHEAVASQLPQPLEAALVAHDATVAPAIAVRLGLANTGAEAASDLALVCEQWARDGAAPLRALAALMAHFVGLSDEALHTAARVDANAAVDLVAIATPLAGGASSLREALRLAATAAAPALARLVARARARDAWGGRIDESFVLLSGVLARVVVDVATDLPRALRVALPTLVFAPVNGVLTKERLAEVESTPAVRDTGCSYRAIKVPSRLVRTLLCKHRMYEEASDEGPWTLLWTCRHIHPTLLSRMSSWQRVNHFPSSFQLTRKDCLWRTYRAFRERAGALAGFGHFVPETLCLPSDAASLAALLATERAEAAAASDAGLEPPVRRWIIKPASGSYGRGISVVDSLEGVAPQSPVVLQQYIARPLVVNGCKFDMRLYVLVTSYDPLRVYLYPNGLARFAVEPYNLDSSMLDSPHVHLTNVTLNRNHPKFTKNESADDDTHGTVWSVVGLKARLSADLGAERVTAAFAAVDSLIVQSLVAVQPAIAAILRRSSRHDESCFELYGYDVLLDAELKPWLLEVNAFPSVLCGTPMDLQIKAGVVADVLTMAAIVPLEFRVPDGHAPRRRTAGPNADPDALAARVIREWSAGTAFRCLYPTVDDTAVDALLHRSVARYSTDVREVIFAGATAAASVGSATAGAGVGSASAGASVGSASAGASVGSASAGARAVASAGASAADGAGEHMDLS